MVAQAIVKQDIQITVPKGETIATLRVENGTVFPAGSIPNTLVALDMQYSRPLFEEGAIPASLKSLLIDNLVKGSHYPSSLELFINQYTAAEPLPACARVLIHFNQKDKVSKQDEHYLFYYGSVAPIPNPRDAAFIYAPPAVVRVFERDIWTVKRTPVPKPAPVPEPTLVSESVVAQSSPIDAQVSIVQAKIELINEKKTLIQAKQKLVEEQLKALRAVQ